MITTNSTLLTKHELRQSICTKRKTAFIVCHKLRSCNSSVISMMSILRVFLLHWCPVVKLIGQMFNVTRIKNKQQLIQIDLSRFLYTILNVSTRITSTLQKQFMKLICTSKDSLVKSRAFSKQQSLNTRSLIMVGLPTKALKFIIKLDSCLEECNLLLSAIGLTATSTLQIDFIWIKTCTHYQEKLKMRSTLQRTSVVYNLFYNRYVNL